MLEQADPLARVLAGSGQTIALGRLVGEDIVRVFQAAQTTAGPRVAVEDGERDVAVFPLRGPDELKVIQDHARAPQLQVGSDHLPRVEPGPGRVAAEAAAIGVDCEMTGINPLGGGGKEVLEHRGLHAGADFRIDDAANPLPLIGGSLGRAQPEGGHWKSRPSG